MMAGFIKAMLAPLASLGSAFAQGGPRRQYKWNKKAAEDANVMNRANQQWLLDQEKGIQAEQRQYDSPEAQMSRYKSAGLNPHLIYGTGSSAGQAFPIHSGDVPGVNIQAPSAAYPDVAGKFIAASQAQAQMGLTEARTVESGVNSALKSIQMDIAKTNPMLDPKVAAQVSDSMMRTADLKGSEAEFMKSHWVDVDANRSYRAYAAKIVTDVEAMVQRLGLNTADLSIKNKIFESKEFENALKEVQMQWLKDAQVTPEHIRQGLMLLLSKMLGR